VFANRDFVAEQDRVYRPLPATCVINVMTVDSNKRGTRVHQMLGCSKCQERVVLEVAISTPMTIPSSPNEDRATLDINASEQPLIHGDPRALGVDHDRIKMR
jgi:hypothetical protein